MTAAIALAPAMPGDAGAIAAVQVACWRESYRGIVADDFLDRMSVARQTESWQRILGRADSRAWIAGPAGNPVGFAQSATGELHTIYVRRSAARRGLGRRLFHRCAQDVRARGHRAMHLWVFRDNAPARRFYDRLGGRLDGEQSFSLEGQEIVEVRYVFAL